MRAVRTLTTCASAVETAAMAVAARARAIFFSM